ncbi:NYN domain-containing protein [Mediterraneibacter massiliensis]|uniref:NYN domain-containing protein n=1 Tax=Mediterraneibacter massiliensis TaxID=1720300 RepID=UPI0024ACECC4|nr:NYN domain-containing protein [Mediterraneibacter massiliensis]
METKKTFDRQPVRTAILVDGGFYRKRARTLWGNKSPSERADELNDYCYRHLIDNYENRYLYRIFYYDCPPSDKNTYNPITQKTVALSKTPEYAWMTEFLKELKHHRKFALRMGRISETQVHYSLKSEPTKRLLRGDIQISDITQDDLELNLEQKGVDMRIGVDISSLAFKHQVNQIILISGDSDFVPAAKQARREGIDFILDPMRSTIKDDLFEHIDGIRTPRLPQKKE